VSVDDAWRRRIRELELERRHNPPVRPDPLAPHLDTPETIAARRAIAAAAYFWPKGDDE
jgi:hypothetical protein